MKLPFFHIMTNSSYKQQLDASYKEGYETAMSCCYNGQYQKMTEDEKDLRILELSHQNEIFVYKLFKEIQKMKLPFFHVMTNEKYLELKGELKSLSETNTKLDMWYNRHLGEIERLRGLHSKEKARKIRYIENFCHGKD